MSADDSLARALLAMLAFAVYPLWLAAGVVDFACHRATGIERTSGLVESRFHRVQLALAGAAIVLGMALQATAPVLIVLAVLVALHAVAAVLDTRWAAPRRAIPPLEQHVHSVLDAAPVVALAIVVLLHRAQLAAPEWSLRWRDPPLPPSIWLAVLGSAGAFAVLPALLEWRRCAAARSTSPA